MGKTDVYLLLLRGITGIFNMAGNVYINLQDFTNFLLISDFKNLASDFINFK